MGSGGHYLFCELKGGGSSQPYPNCAILSVADVELGRKEMSGWRLGFGVTVPLK